MSEPSQGWSSLEGLPLLLALLEDGSGRSLPVSATLPEGRAQPRAGTARLPPSPGTFPSQSHSHVVNGLINRLTGALLAPAGVHPLLCLAASLLSRSSAMVRRMPFPRGREIHGLLPCSMREATLHQETWTAAELSLTAGGSSRSHTLPMLGHLHMATALVQQKPLRKVPEVCRPTPASFSHAHEECTSAKTEPPALYKPDKRAHREWQDSRGVGGEGNSWSEQLPRPHHDLSTEHRSAPHSQVLKSHRAAA